MNEDETIDTLAAILNLQHDRARCRELLERTGFDLQSAVERGLSADDAAADVGLRRRHRPDASRGGTNTGRAAPSARRTSSSGRVHHGGGANPVSFVAALGFGIVKAAVKLSVGIVDAALRVILPAGAYARFSRPLLFLAASMDSSNSPRRALAGEGGAESRAREFSDWFSETFHDGDASNGVHFVQLSHREAFTFAHRETKLLFVYLHAPAHHESEVFCAQVLADPTVTAYVNENFVAWGGNVRDGDAYSLSTGLKPTAYPCVAILDSVSGGNGSASLVMSCEGFIDVDGLIGACEEALAGQNGSLNDARARIAEVDASRRLREEQDAALAESLARDAARVRELEAQRDAEEAERRRMEEERRVVEEEKRKLEEAERQRVETIESRRASKMSRLRNEPEDGADGVSKLAIRLPDGSRAARRFHCTDTIADVYDFVDTLEQLDEVSYSLVTNFPRRQFSRSEPASLVDAGVHPNGAMFVQTETESL
jgi:FAS-associated factor 2